MIGVLCRPSQAPAVREFFELFKTSWERCRPGRHYDVVVATLPCVPPAGTRLLLLYGADNGDRQAPAGAPVRAGAVTHRGARLPIYGQLTVFDRPPASVPCLMSGSGTVAFVVDAPDLRVIRIGFDLFDEVTTLVATGQPVGEAHVPTLDRHIDIVRGWILDAGVDLVEIPPVPSGHRYGVCLTHDIDFVGIRQHRFDHSMWGFLYRATVGAVGRLLRGRLSVGRVLESWRAALSVPFILAGWVRDFWEPFGWYLRVEQGLPATYYLIPFKRRAGAHVPGPAPARRATAYDVGDLPGWTDRLLQAGCELGVHGIDAWHDAEKGRDELRVLAGVTGSRRTGVRMHWLLQQAGTPRALEDAGYDYDSTAGYNETIGYRNGTTQVYQPAGVERLLELPLHIQDGALFFPHRLDLSEPEAWRRCTTLMTHAQESGGVLTVLWHDRSHGPERFWGGFYVALLDALKSSGAWFGTAGQVVAWFRKRRQVRFDCRDAGMAIHGDGEPIHPPLTVRCYHATRRSRPRSGDDAPQPLFTDTAWDGTTPLTIGAAGESRRFAAAGEPELCAQ